MGRRHRSGTIVVVLFASVAASLPALPALAQQGETCIGRFCGLDRGFEARHCHLRPGGDPDGNDYCWSSLPADFACEDLGYTLNVACPLRVEGEAVGAVGGQTLVLTGYQQFRSQIVQPATTRQAERDAAAAAEEEEEDGERGGGPRFSEITTALELEDWELGGVVEGQTLGARFDWARQTAGGSLLGAAVSYQDADPDEGDSVSLFNGQLSFGRVFGSGPTEWSWAAFGSVSQVSGAVDDTLFGGGGRVSFVRPVGADGVLSGGALAQAQTSDELEDDLINVGAGVAYGFPIAQRLALDLELFAVKVIEPDVDDDSFFTVAGTLSYYLSPRFTLTGGVRTLEGQEGVESIAFTVGASTRFY